MADLSYMPNLLVATLMILGNVSLLSTVTSFLELFLFIIDSDDDNNNDGIKLVCSV